MVAVWLLLVPAAALVCPTFNCGSLGSLACTKKVSPAQIMLNDETCADGTSCFASGVYEWWWLETTSSGSTFNCKSGLNSTIADLPCTGRAKDKDLLSGAHPKDCVDDSDCQTKDHVITPGACACSLRIANSKGICTPDPSSSLYDQYWARCSTMTTVEKQYWNVFIPSYVYLQGDVACSLMLIELQMAKAASDDLLNLALPRLVAVYITMAL